MSGTGKVVCVTGGSGFIASWLIKLLLARGYSVHATVRSLDAIQITHFLIFTNTIKDLGFSDGDSGSVPTGFNSLVSTFQKLNSKLDDPKKTEHLLALDGAKERLSLFEANLTEEGSFDSAFNGCECVFHMASPVLFTVDDPQAQLLDPAVKGTLNVLKSAAKVLCLKRVVFTSSTSAVMFGVKLPESGDVVDETWFSDPVICEQKKNWYALSKTLAEETAVKFSKENGLELVVINPGYVIGPLLQPTLNHSSEGFMSIIKTGKDIFPDGIYRLVDVRDVAIAHILAFEKPKANGRYLMVGNNVHSSLILKIVDKLYPAFGHSERYKGGKFVEKLPFNVSREKAEVGLGVDFTPMEVSIKDIVESLKEKNLLTF